MQITIVTLTMLGSIAPDNPVASSYLDALKALDAEATSAKAADKPAPFLIVKLRSSGGYIEMARQMAKHMFRLQPVCYVAEAQSAALQILVPACSSIVVAKDSVLGFHSAAGCYPTNLYDGQDKLLMLRESLRASVFMGRVMEAGLGAASEGSCAPLRRVWPEVASLSCPVIHMVNETTMPPSEFVTLFPLASKRVTIKPSVKDLDVVPYPKTQGEGESLCK